MQHVEYRAPHLQEFLGRIGSPPLVENIGTRQERLESQDDKEKEAHFRR